MVHSQCWVRRDFRSVETAFSDLCITDHFQDPNKSAGALFQLVLVTEDEDKEGEEEEEVPEEEPISSDICHVMKMKI